MTKQCRECGAELIDDARFCKNCGASVSYYASQPEHPQQTYVPPIDEESYNKHLAAGIVASAFMPLAGYLMTVYLYTRKSQKAKNNAKIVLVAAIFFTVIWYFINMM